MSALSYFNEPAPLAWDVAAAIFGPTGEGGLYDPSALDTIFQDANGTTPAAPGSPVGLVLDKSGNSLNLSQPTTAARPILARMPKTGRRNLLRWTEDFSNSAWVKRGAVTVAPLPEQEGAWLIEGLGTTGGNDDVYQQVNGLTSGSPYTPSVEIRRIATLGTVLLLNPSSATSGQWAIDLALLPDDWVRIAPGHPAVTVTNAFETTSGGIGGFHLRKVSAGAVSLQVRHPQINYGTEPTPYQRVTNAYDVTEAGVPDTYSLVYDLADDALTTTLPQAINGDILIAGTKGSIIEPVNYAAGSTFTIGPDTYTGGTPGILRAIGDIVGVLLIDRNLTQNERDNLIRHYKGKGAKGLLVPGPELVVNSGDPFEDTSAWFAGSSILSVVGGELEVEATAPSGQDAYQAFSTSEGRVYICSFALRSAGENSRGARFRLNNLGFWRNSFNVIPGGEVETTFVFSAFPGSYTAQVAPGTIAAYGAIGDKAYLRHVSVRELRPQEDWT